MPQYSKWLHKICFFRERLILFFFLFFLCISTLQLILLNGYSSLWSSGRTAVKETDEYLGAFYLPVCARASSCVSDTHWKPLSAVEWVTIVSAWLHLDAITLCCQVLRWHLGDSEEMGEKATLDIFHSYLCQAVISSVQTQDGASWVSSTLRGDSSKARPTVWEYFQQSSLQIIQKKKIIQKWTSDGYSKGNRLSLSNHQKTCQTYSWYELNRSTERIIKSFCVKCFIQHEIPSKSSAWQMVFNHRGSITN